MTTLNKVVETQYQQDDAASVNQGIDSPGKQCQRENLLALYENLSSRTHCGGRTHSALVRVPNPSDGRSTSLDMHLSVCSQSKRKEAETEQVDNWHEITFNLDKYVSLKRFSITSQ